MSAAGSKGIDYNKLIETFGSQPISPELIAKFERVTGAPAHPWIKVPRTADAPLAPRSPASAAR